MNAASANNHSDHNYNMNASVNASVNANGNANGNANCNAVVDIVDRPDADSDTHNIGYVGMSDAGMLLQQPASSKSVSASVSEPMPPFTVYSSTSASRFVVHNQHMRECMAEFLGTLIMILFGMAVNNQVVLSKDKNGTWLSVNMCWGVAVMLGVHCSEGISGAHLNPAVTIAMATYHRLPWHKVPGYLLAQLLGAFVGAAAIYALYYQVIDVVDPDYTFTRANFATYPSADISNVTAFYTEFLATAMLLVGVFSITDKRNRPASPFGTPVHFMLLIWAIGMAFGMNTGYAINPARDLGPRVFTSIAGWGSQVFTLRNHYFWIPLVAPPLGGVCGAGLYKLLVELHHPPQKSDDLEYQSQPQSYAQQQTALPF